MINAVAIQSQAAADLMYPALLLEGYLEALIAGKKPEAPASAIWAIERFMRDATDDEQMPIDPVASAVSYQLADTAVRAVKKSGRGELRKNEPVDDVLRAYLSFLQELQVRPAIAAAKAELAKDLIEFLHSLRLRGQGNSYSRLASCV